MEFKFKKFTIQQTSKVFKFGTDAALIATFADALKAHKVLEIGTGTGVVTLMMAQRNANPTYVGIDISEEAILLANQNLQNYPLPHHIQFKHSTLQKFESDTLFDLIVSNPPFFENSTKSHSDVNLNARHTDTLSLNDFLHHSSRLMNSEGVLQFIYPSRYITDIENQCRELNLHVTEITSVRSKIGKEVKRVIVSIKKHSKPKKEKELIIEEQNREYTPEVHQMFKDFYLKL